MNEIHGNIKGELSIVNLQLGEANLQLSEANCSLSIVNYSLSINPILVFPLLPFRHHSRLVEAFLYNPIAEWIVLVFVTKHIVC